MADLFDKEELGVVNSLFGTSPEGLQIAREQAAAKAGQSAGLNLLGGVLGQTGMFAERGAQGLRQVFGQQSPEERLMGLRQQAQQQFDTNTPQGLAQAAQFLNQQGDAVGARQMVMLAQGQMQKSATLGKTLEETRQLGRKEIEVGVPGSPEMVQKVLVDKDGNIIQQLGAPYSRFTSKQNLSITNQGPKNVLELDAAQAKDYATAFNTAAKTLPTLERMQSLIDKGVISGSVAEARTATLGVLQGLGVNTSNATKVLANTEAYNKELINLLQGVIKQYGTNPSNIDVKTALEGLPNLVKSPEGVQQVLTTLTKVNRDIYNESKTGLDYFRQNQGSFAGYTPKVPLGLVEQPKIKLSKPLDQMTAEELQAALQQ